MDDRVMDDARALTTATWKRAFRLDAALRTNVFRSLVRNLPDELNETLPDYETTLHPSQSINVSEDKNSITLEDDRGWIVKCHINPATSGQLQLQFFKRGWTSESGTIMMLLLDCVGKDTYVWISSKHELIPADKLAEHVLRHLFTEAVQVVKQETPQ